MLDYNNKEIQKDLFKGQIGLEKESLRLEHSGRMAHTPHYAESKHITRDFCENQTEINTAPHEKVEDALLELHENNAILQQEAFKHQEMLWPFSNPGYIRNEEDIPVAQFDERESTRYREYLKHRYGAYKMTYSGIHYNYSFSLELLEKAYKLLDPEGRPDFKTFVDEFYLDLAQKAAKYGWIITVLTAASPVLDSSFWNEGIGAESYFSGYSSPRSSEIGYWNSFVPILDYSSLDNYANSIEKYVKQGLLKESRELYYPIRLKPRGKYALETLKTGIDHIELRMIDLNPMEMDSLNYKDAQFLQYFLIWLSCLEDFKLTDQEQIEAVSNFKRAASFDIDLSFIFESIDEKKSVRSAAISILLAMEAFYESLDDSKEKKDALENIQWQMKKLTDSKNYRYANIIYDIFNEDYLIKGIDLARFYQRHYLNEKEDKNGG